MAKTTRDTGPKGRNDAYTVMLVVTLLAIGVGCLLTYMDYDEYGNKPVPKEPVPALPKLGSEPAGGAPVDKGGGTTGLLREPPLARPAVAAVARPGDEAPLLPIRVAVPVAADAEPAGESPVK